MIVGLGRPNAQESQLPFQAGEKLTFDLKWTIFKAGEATLEVYPVTTINGEDAFHFVMTAESTPFIDVFYKVRDRIDAYTDPEMNHSVYYKQSQHEGETQREIVVTFNWVKQEAQYSNFGEQRTPIQIKEGVFDPLSAFYFTRTVDLHEGLIVRRPVTDGKKCVIGKAKVVKKEWIIVNGNSYETFLIEPELEHIGGVFEKSEDAILQVWVTADHRHIPVMVKSKVVVGSFVAELTSSSGLTPLPVKSKGED